MIIFTDYSIIAFHKFGFRRRNNCRNVAYTFVTDGDLFSFLNTGYSQIIKIRLYRAMFQWFVY